MKNDDLGKMPSIRFKGFTNAWELRRLGDITKRVRGNDGRMDLPTLTISAGSGWLDQRDRFSGNIAGNEQENYTLLRNGELSYNHGNSKLAKYGAVFELKTFKEALVPRVYHSFKATPQTRSLFIEYMFASKKPDRELGKLISSGARMDGLLNISYDSFMGILITLPSVNEQQHIGTLFQSLDNLITLHQRKLDKTKELKKTMLSKMFPKNDEDKPELRFSGFTDAWELRRVNEIFKVTRGQVLAATETSEKQSTEMPYPVYSSQTKNDGLMGYYNNYLFDTAITWTTDGANAGTVNYRKGKFYSTNVNGVLLSSAGFANKAIAEILNQEAWKWVSHVGNPKLMNNVMGDIIISIPPSLEEHNRLSEFFTSLDNLITLHQRELEQLINIKKTLLKHMFV